MTCDDGRRPLIDAFLERNGLIGAERSPLAGDASGRRYSRLRAGDRAAVLMDAPPQTPDPAARRARLVQNTIEPFVRMADHLRARGFSAPQIYDADAAAGLCLIEDLGDGSYTRVLEAGGDPGALYRTAAAALAHLASEPAPDMLAPYDRGVLDAELAVMTEWWAPRFAPGRGADAAALRATFEKPIARVLAQGTGVTVLRDVHADNLFWLPERDGHATVGLIDFQDGLSGHPAYDFMSLVDDVRRDVPREVVEAARRTFLERRPDLDPDAFDAARAVFGAQRQIKILGVFSRLAFRDGKSDYLTLLPRTWRLLEAALAHPALAEARRWFDEVAPRSTRTDRPARPS